MKVSVASLLLSLSFVHCVACTRAEPRKSAPRPAASSAASLAPRAHASAAAPAPAATGPLRPITVQRFYSELRSFGGKGTLVNVFASWCGPCRDEVPMLEMMSENLERDGIRVVFVSFDEYEDRDKALSFIKAHDVRSPTFLALDGLAFRQGLNPKWPGMIPATFLFDASLKLRYFWGGPAFEDEIFPIIEGFLAGKPIDGQANFAITHGRAEP